MLAIARQLGELLGLDQLAVHQKPLVAVPLRPRGHVLVVALARFDQRGEDLHRAGRGRVTQLRGDVREGGGGDGDAAVGAELRAELRVEQAQEVVDLGDRGHGGFSAAPRDALLDGHRRRETGDVVHIGLLHLLDELAGVGGHAVEEAALSLGKEDVEGERRLARSAEAGDDDEFVARDVERDVLEVVLARSGDADALVVRRRRGRRLGGAQGPASGVGFERGAQERGGAGLRITRHLLGCPGGDDGPAVLARLRAHVDHVVGALDDLDVVLDDDERVSGVHEALEHAEQARDVVEVQPGGGFVEEEEPGLGLGVGQPRGQLEALRLAAGEEARRLAEAQVAEADILQRLQRTGDLLMLRETAKKLDGLGHRHFQHVVDGLALEQHAQHVGLEAFAAAGGADERDVAEELHLDALVAKPGAALAAAVVRVEAEGRRAEPRTLGRGRLAEQVADVVPRAEVDDRGRAGRLARGRLVHHDDFADVFDPGELADRPRVLVHRLAALAQQVAVEQAVDERGLARPGDAGHAGEESQREVGVDLADVVQRGAAQAEEAPRLAAARGHGDRAAAVEIVGGERAGDGGHATRRTAEHQLAAGLAAAGADVGQPVRRADDRLVVLDHEERVPVVAQAPHDAEELVEVARVEAHAGLVHDEEGVDEGGAEAGGQVDALDFAAGERAGGAVERQVTEADLAEIGEPRGDLVEEQLRGVVAFADGHAREKFREPRDRASGHPGQRERLAIGAGQPVVQCLGLEASPAALRAFVVAAVAAEQHAHVHLVGLGLEPVEVALHAIPAVVVPSLVHRFARLAVALDDPPAVLLGQLVERAMQVHPAAARVAHQVGLAFLRHAALERPHHALAEGARVVGDDALPVEADDAAEPAAFRARPERVVEAEQARGGRTDVEVAPRAMPPGGGRVGFIGLRVHEDDAALAESERGLDGLGQARAVGDRETVLDHMDGGGEFGRRFLIDPQDASADPRAQVALLAEEVEEFGRRSLLRIARADGEGDQHLTPGEFACGLADDAGGIFRGDRAAAGRAGRRGEAGKEEFEVVVDLGDRADGRARGADIVRLLDGDGRGNALDAVHPRLVHAVEELPRVRREGLDVAPLSLRVDRVEGQRRLARTARAGDDVEKAARQFEVEAPQVVLPRGANAQGAGAGRGLGLGARSVRHRQGRRTGGDRGDPSG